MSFLPFYAPRYFWTCSFDLIYQWSWFRRFIFSPVCKHLIRSHYWKYYLLYNREIYLMDDNDLQKRKNPPLKCKGLLCSICNQCLGLNCRRSVSGSAQVLASLGCFSSTIFLHRFSLGFSLGLFGHHINLPQTLEWASLHNLFKVEVITVVYVLFSTTFSLQSPFIELAWAQQVLCLSILVDCTNNCQLDSCQALCPQHTCENNDITILSLCYVFSWFKCRFLLRFPPLWY